MIQKEQLALMKQIADDLFGTEFQEPMDTIQQDTHIINNASHTIAVVIDNNNEILGRYTKPIKPIGVSCSHSYGYKRESNDKINYDFENNNTITSNFYDPSKEILIKNHEITEHDYGFINPEWKDGSGIVLKGKNVSIMISGLNYDDMMVGFASMEEYNQLKKKKKSELMKEIEQDPNNHKFTVLTDSKEAIICNRIHGIKKKHIESRD